MSVQSHLLDVQINRVAVCVLVFASSSSEFERGQGLVDNTQGFEVCSLGVRSVVMVSFLAKSEYRGF